MDPKLIGVIASCLGILLGYWKVSGEDVIKLKPTIESLLEATKEYHLIFGIIAISLIGLYSAFQLHKLWNKNRNSSKADSTEKQNNFYKFENSTLQGSINNGARSTLGSSSEDKSCCTVTTLAVLVSIAGVFAVGAIMAVYRQSTIENTFNNVSNVNIGEQNSVKTENHYQDSSYLIPVLIILATLIGFLIFFMINVDAAKQQVNTENQLRKNKDVDTKQDAASTRDDDKS
ncbi:uncharacterized protein LOC143452444 [Clavelina lepadiformis]|uniref:uncharacterized protein LOC143452444 n=1 Tax=Clavelina lepadiformis TaxID=159417 RepID=UPI0040424DF6